MTKKTSVVLPDGTAALLEALARATGSTPDVPHINQSEFIRLLLADAGDRLVDGDLADVEVEGVEISAETLTSLIPDHATARYLREEVKAESWLMDMRGGFEGRVRSQLRERFRNGYKPDEAADFAETYVKEARIYWSIIEDEPDVLEEKIAFVHDRLEEYRMKWEVSTYDPNAEWLTFDGVEAGEREEVVEAVPDEILREIRERVQTGKSAEGIAHAIANLHDVDEELALELVQRAKSSEPLTAEALEGGAEDVDVDTPALPDGGVADD